MLRRYYSFLLVFWMVGASTIDFVAASTNDGADGAVFDLDETFVPHDDIGWQFDIKIGDARLPFVDASDESNSQLRTKQNRFDSNSPMMTVSAREKMTDPSQKKSSKDSKKGKPRIPDNLFHTTSPTVTAMPSHPRSSPPSSPFDTTTLQPSVRATDSPYSKTNRDYDDDDDDDGDDAATKKKEKYAGAVLPPTYNQVNGKDAGDADGDSMKAPKKIKSYTDKNGNPYYAEKHASSQIDDDNAEADNASKGHYKKTKRHEYGKSKGSEHKLQKSKEETPTTPSFNVTSAPNILMSDTTPSPQRQVPSFSPTLSLMPLLASQEELPTNRSLSSISLSFDFAQSRIPLNPEVYDLVAVTGAFLESRLDMNYPGTTVLLLIVETSFRLMQPFDIILGIEVENLPSPPPTTEELDSVVRATFQEQESLEALISVVENLPDANIFSTTTAVTYMERPKNESSTTRSINIVGVSTAAAVFALLLLLGGGCRRCNKNNDLKPSSKNYVRGKAPIDGGQTITGETCAATTIGTTSKQTRFAFDEGMSLTSRASDWTPRKGEMYKLASDDEEADCYGIRPLFSDTNEDDDEEEEKRVDLLSNPGNQPQSFPNEASRSSDHTMDNDDLTVDSYVPLRVVDLIKHFTPGSRR